MAVTRLSDAVVPEVFTRYMMEDTKTTLAFWQSGLITNNAELSNFMGGGGILVQIPFWRDLPRGNGAKTASDNPDQKIVHDKITAGKQSARRIYRTNSWSSMVLTGILAGSDPMTRIRSRVATFWNLEFQDTLVAMLDGILEDNVANDGSDMVLDIGIAPTAAANVLPNASNRISAETTIDASATMGDARQELGVMIAHSRVIANLEKGQLISFEKPATNDVSFKVFQGKYRVVESDEATVIGTVDGNGRTVRALYTTWLAAPGSVAWHEEAAPMAVAVDVDQDAGNGSGQEMLYTRRQFMIHAFGFAYVRPENQLAGQFPSNAELAQAATWDRVAADRKHIPFAAIRSNG